MLGVLNDEGEIALLAEATCGFPQWCASQRRGSGDCSRGGGQIELQPDLLYRISKDGVIYSSNTEEEVAEDVEVAQLSKGCEQYQVRKNPRRVI